MRSRLALVQILMDVNRIRHNKLATSGRLQPAAPEEKDNWRSRQIEAPTAR
jgi:hypothetical protein